MIEEKPSLHVHIGHDVRILALVGVCVNRIGKEGSFGRLKDYRRIATRFDKDVRNFLAALCIAVTVIWWI